MPPEDEDWTWYACPCCDKEFAYSKWRDQHVLDDHLLKTDGNHTTSGRCWCGKWFSWDAKAWLQQHWDRHGGVLAHYIACLLGID